MVEFITLFLGLVAGVQPVEVTVGGDVVAVELRLDGRPIGLLQEAPWEMNCDLGKTLVPHELEAIGLDAAGKEISRAHQWINLPRARTEARFVFDETRGEAPRSARLLWSSVDAMEPDSLRVRFDGRLLEGATAQKIDLPPYNPEEIHLLEAELQLGDTLTRTESLVGGKGESLDQGLTAIPMKWTGGGLPKAKDMEGWLEHRGQALRVVAVERGPGEVVMVQDLTTKLQGRLARLQEQALATPVSFALQRPTGLKAEDRYRVLLPIPAMVSGATRSVQFPMSPDLWGEQKEVFSTGATDRQIPAPTAQGILAGIPILMGKAVDTTDQRLADAVASAGLAAAANSRPRAVVLITGEGRSDKSRFPAATVRSYLAGLRVPLLVWSPQAKKTAAQWGRVRDISSSRELFQAIRSLRSVMDDQVMVWVEGRHLPNQVELGAAASKKMQLLDSNMEGTSATESALPDFPTVVAESHVPSEPTGLGKSLPELPNSENSAEFAVDEVDLRDRFSESVEVRVVNIDVVATGRDGQRVRDLEQQDFVVMEDGKPVEVSHFLGPTPEETAAKETPQGAAESFHLVVFLDLFHLQAAQLPKVLRAVKESLPADLRGISTSLVSYDGGIRIDQGFTSDPAEFQRSLEKLVKARPSKKGHRAKGRLRGEEALAAEFADIWGEFSEARKISDPRSRDAALAMARSRRDGAFGQMRAVAEIRRHEIGSLLGVLGQMIGSLGPAEGRKALFYVGDRLALEPARALYEEGLLLLENDPAVSDSAGSATSRLESEMFSLSIRSDFDALLKQANGNGVTLYSMTPLNLAGTAGTLAGSAGKPGFQGRSLSFRDEMVKEAACHLATDTGGLCRAGASKLAPGLKEAFADLNSVYSLGFSPERPADGSFHRVRVKVQRPGVRVRHRQGYLDKPREDQVEDRLNAALIFDAQENPLGAELRSSPLRKAADGLAPNKKAKGGAARVLPLEVRIPTEGLALLPVADGTAREAKCRLLVTTLTERGQSTAVQEIALVIRVTEEQLTGGRFPLYSHRIDLSVLPDATKVAIGIWDEAGRQGSFLSQPLEALPVSPPATAAL